MAYSLNKSCTDQIFSRHRSLRCHGGGIAYIGVKQTENNDVSGLTNLARNIGGSCGTAFVATMLLSSPQGIDEKEKFGVGFRPLFAVNPTDLPSSPKSTLPPKGTAPPLERVEFGPVLALHLGAATRRYHHDSN
jgi:hypothetical protein